MSLGAMQDWSMRISHVIDHAAWEAPNREIVTRWADGSETRTDWAGVRRDAKKMSQALQALGRFSEASNEIETFAASSAGRDDQAVLQQVQKSRFLLKVRRGGEHHREPHSHTLLACPDARAKWRVGGASTHRRTPTHSPRNRSASVYTPSSVSLRILTPCRRRERSRKPIKRPP